MDATASLARIEMPTPSFVMTEEGYRVATYTWGDPEAEPVLCVHGFASSCRDNWVETGWVRDLLRAGYRVIGVDQRGHGQSDKPVDPRAYSMRALAHDLITVLDTYSIDQVRYVGYSLGARVGWQLAVDAPEHVSRAVLGGIPDGTPLARLELDQAKAYAKERIPVDHAVTRNYVTLAERVPGNDLTALVALAEGMRFGTSDPDPARPPRQPVLFATGSEDAILERSRALATTAPHGRFVEIPDRHHFNTPGSRVFRQSAIDFLGEAPTDATGGASQAAPAAPAEEPTADAASATPVGRRIRITYCTQCGWMLRAAWVAQELLTTFQDELRGGGVTLEPGTGGVFEVHAEDARVWSRKDDGGFPDIVELKRRVRDRIAPDRELGHADRAARA